MEALQTKEKLVVELTKQHQQVSLFIFMLIALFYTYRVFYSLKR